MRRVMRVLGVLAAFLCVFPSLGTARAGGVQLDEIGIRYYAAADELFATRNQTTAEALDALGLSEAVALAAMESDGCHLMVHTASGSRVDLCVEDAPAGMTARDIAELDVQGREAFLQALGERPGVVSAAWQTAPADYALCQADRQTQPALHTLALYTLYWGKLYGFSMDIVGRDVAQEDADTLCAVAERALRLSASERADALTLPARPAQNDAPAELEALQTAIPLTLTPVPAHTERISLTLTGLTAPEAKVRVKVNGESTSFQAVEEDGSFSLNLKGLKPGQENKAEVIARRGKETSVVAFSVWSQGASTPLAVRPTEGVAFENQTTINGLTLPNSAVTITKGSAKTTLEADENGAFSFPLNTKKEGNYTFSVRAVGEGYRRAEISGMIRRTSQENVTKATEELNIVLVNARPAAYAGRALLLEGAVEALAYENGQPKCMLKVGGNRFIYLCERLNQLEIGASVKLLGVLTGEGGEMNASGKTYPTARLQMIVP